jgi:hypothetical protein
MWNDLWTETTSDDTEQFSLSLFIFYLNIIFESCYQTIYRGKVFAGGVFRAVHARCNLTPLVKVSSVPRGVTARTALQMLSIALKYSVIVRDALTQIMLAWPPSLVLL